MSTRPGDSLHLLQIRWCCLAPGGSGSRLARRLRVASGAMEAVVVDCRACFGEPHGRRGLRLQLAFASLAGCLWAGTTQPREHTALGVRVHSGRRTRIAMGGPDQRHYGDGHHDEALDARPRVPGASAGAPNHALVPVARSAAVDSTGKKSPAQRCVVDVVFCAAPAHRSVVSASRTRTGADVVAVLPREGHCGQARDAEARSARGCDLLEGGSCGGLLSRVLRVGLARC